MIEVRDAARWAGTFRHGRCPTCSVTYRWKGGPRLGEARCIADDVVLRRTQRSRAARDVDGEWLR